MGAFVVEVVLGGGIGGLRGSRDDSISNLVCVRDALTAEATPLSHSQNDISTPSQKAIYRQITTVRSLCVTVIKLYGRDVLKALLSTAEIGSAPAFAISFVLCCRDSACGITSVQ